MNKCFWCEKDLTDEGHKKYWKDTYYRFTENFLCDKCNAADESFSEELRQKKAEIVKND